MSVIEFKNEIVNGDIKEDLQVLKQVTKRPGQPGNLNFPIALYILSCMEYLGSFFTLDTRNGAFLDNITAYMDNCFNDNHGYPFDFKIYIQKWFVTRILSKR